LASAKTAATAAGRGEGERQAQRELRRERDAGHGPLRARPSRDDRMKHSLPRRVGVGAWSLTW